MLFPALAAYYYCKQNKRPGAARDVITTIITRHAGAFYLAIQITTGAEAFAALQYDFIIYRELSCLRNQFA